MSINKHSPAQEYEVWDMVFPYAPEAGNTLQLLEKYRSAGVTFVSITAAGDDHSPAEALAIVSSIRAHVSSAPDRYVFCSSLDDVDAARNSKRLGVGVNFEGSACFARNLDLVDGFKALGVSHAILAFNQQNDVGGGCAEVEDAGLTRYGRSLVRRMNSVGMLIDLSHVGRRTSLEAIDESSEPTIFSHSAVDAVRSHYRNVTDEQISACIGRGGVIGLSGSSIYLGESLKGEVGLFRHIDYIVQKYGPQGVGIGLDFVVDGDAVIQAYSSNENSWPLNAGEPWKKVSFLGPDSLIELIEIMDRNGYSGNDIRGVMSDNLRRVASQTWSCCG